MTIHKEGYKSISIAGLLYVILNYFNFSLLSFAYPGFSWIIFGSLTLLFGFVISFFRIPKRIYTRATGSIIAPADGKVVVIEEMNDIEYFQGRRLQISVFMSPANVHVNRCPVDGEVIYSKYHKGKYLVAWNPKSSTENECFSTVLKTPSGEVLVKQIAGALAQRISNYLHVGEPVKQNEELGFIRFGSRVDLLLPLGTRIRVKIGDTVKGGVTVLADW
jgi:phosphatidylserine decarboxylase